MQRFIREAYKHLWRGTRWQPANVAGHLVYPQKNNWACGPWSLRHCFLKWGYDIDPYAIARMARSTRNGTNERQLELGAYLCGAKLTNHVLTSAKATKLTIDGSLRRGHPVILCVDNNQHWIACLHRDHRGYLIFDSDRPGPVIQLRGWNWIQQQMRTASGQYHVAPVQRPR